MSYLISILVLKVFCNFIFLGVPPYLEDPYESQLVFGCMSDCYGAGDGLFLKKNVKANTTVAFYNGIRVRPGEKAAFANTGYQIFVDWNKRSVGY